MSLGIREIVMYDIKIIYNAIRTPDGTVLESFYRHDFLTHTDENGEVYMVDGGYDYLRRSSNTILFEELSVFSEDSIEKQREVFKWGTHGKLGKDSLSYVILKDMGTNHILNCVRDKEKHLSEEDFKNDWVVTIFKKELEYRKGKTNETL